MAARRAQQPRPRLRRRGPGPPRLAPKRPHARLLQPSRVRRPRQAATSTARAVSPPSVLAELDPPRDAEAYLCGPTPFMDEISAGLAAIGLDASRHPHRAVRPRAGSDAGHRAAPRGRPPTPAGEPGAGPTIEFARRPRRPVERAAQPARTRRDLRRARPLVVPHRRLPNCEAAHRRHRRLQPRPGRTLPRTACRLVVLAPSRSSRWSPTRRALAIAVSAGFTALEDGKKLVSTT